MGNYPFSPPGDTLIEYLAPSGDTTGATDYGNIQAALNSGKAVNMTAGTFWVNQVLQIPGNAAMYGASLYLTFVKMAAAANLAAVAASTGWTTSANGSSVAPCVLRAITFDGNSANQSSGTGYGVVLQTSYSYIEDCAFNNTLGDGLRFDYYGANGSSAIGNSAVENRVDWCQFRTNGGFGLNVSDASFNTFTDGWVTNCVSQAASSSGMQITAGAGWVIRDNHVYTAGQHGILVGTPFMTEIAGNYIENWGTSASSGTYGAIDADAFFINDAGSGSAITGNRINLNTAPGNAGSTMWGITAAAVSGGQGTLAITGNVFTAKDNTHPANYGALQLWNQSGSSTLNATTAGNMFIGNWGKGKIVTVPNGGTLNLNGADSIGADSSGSAPVLTALGAVSGTAIQLSDLTRDYMVYLEVTTAGTATSITLGHTSAASDVTILSSVAVAAGDLYSFRLPAGWYFKWTGVTTAIGNQNAVGC